MKRVLLPALLLLSSCTTCGETSLERTVALMAPSVRAVEFGDVYVGTQEERTVQLHSAGTRELHIHAVTVAGATEFTVLDRGRDVLPPNESTTVTVAFLALAEGERTAELVVHSDAENGAELRISLRAQGTPLPDCDDDIPCTLDRYDLTVNHCVHDNVEGSCDDNNPCTDDDRCVAGQCSGVARACPADDNPCTRELCDTTLGCTHVPDGTLCQDDDPCTADACDVTLGCLHDAVTDGTPCGLPEGCASIPLCVQGVCTPFPIAEGSRCDDGDLCTTGDACQQGTCVGTRAPSTPQVAAYLPTYGGASAQAAVNDDGTLVFLDPHWPLYWKDLTTRMDVTLVNVTDTGLVARWTATGVAAAPLVGVVAAGRGRMVVISRLGGTTLQARMYTWTESGEVQARGTLPLTGLNLSGVAFVGQVLYLCADTGGHFWIVDFTEPDAPVAPEPQTPAGGCTSLAADPVRNRVWMGSYTGLHALDLTNPLAPVESTVLLSDQVVSEARVHGGLVGAAVDQMAATRVELFDADTLQPRGALSAAQPVWDFALTDTALVTLQAGQFEQRRLTVHDVTNPADPSLISETVLPTSSANLVAATNNYVAVRFTLEAGGFRVYRLPTQPGDGFRMLSAPDQGAIFQLVPFSAGVLALDGAGVRTVFIPAHGPPAFAAGTSVPHDSALQRISLDGVRHDEMVPPFWGEHDPLMRRAYNRPTLLPWLDATDPSSPQMVGSLALTENIVRNLRSDGTVLFSAGMDAVPTLLIHSYDLSAETPAFELESSHRLTLTPSLPSTSSLELYTGHLVLGVEREVHRAAVVAGYPVHPAELFVVQHTPEELSLVARTELPGLFVHSVALSGDRVVTLSSVGEDASSFVVDYYGPYVLHVHRLQGSTLTPGVTGLPLDDSNHLVAFDGRTALVSMVTGLAFVDVTSDPPVLLGLLDLPQPPTHAVSFEDRLVVASRSAVTLVHPPCPGPATP
ncbi:MAG: choice-of-anchor D domain-containing protein [Myxococcota bacterium]